MAGKPKAAKASTSATIFLIINSSPERSRLASALADFGFTVHAYQTAREFLLDSQNLASGVVVTDFRLPEMTGTDLLVLLQEVHPGVPVIFICGQADAPAVIQTGSSEFLFRPVDPVDLQKAVIRAINGEEIDETKLDRAFCYVSDREIEVLELVVAGESSRAIADRLNISTKTVEAHRIRISDKTRADNLAHLVRMFRAWNQD